MITLETGRRDAGFMRIRRNHNLGIEEARQRADRIAADLKQEYNLTANWQGDAMQVRGNGISGELRVDETAIELDVSLGFALKLMEGPIRAVIEKTIDDELV